MEKTHIRAGQMLPGNPSGFGGWTYDLATQILTWSPEANRIYQRDSAAVHSTLEEWMRYVHPDDFAQLETAYQQSVHDASSYQIQHRVLLPGGQLRHVYTTVTYVLNSEGVPVGLTGTVHDITDIVNLTVALNTSESNLRLMMDSLPVSVYARDAEGYYIFANHIFLAHYGLEKADLEGRHLRDFARNEVDYNILKAQDDEVVRSGKKMVVAEFSQADHNGVPKIWRLVKVPFTPVGYTGTCILGIAEDITERKADEEHLKEMARSLLERNESLERYSQIVSHELRGPLSTLLGMTDLVQNYMLTYEEMVDYFRSIEEPLKKLDAISRKMNDVLEAHRSGWLAQH